MREKNCMDWGIDRESFFIKKEAFMMGNGKTIRWMGLENYSIAMEL